MQGKGQPHPPPTVVPLPLPGEGLVRRVALYFVHGKGEVRPLKESVPCVSLPLARGGGTACSPAVTEGIATDEETSFRLFLLINLIPRLRRSPFPF